MDLCLFIFAKNLAIDVDTMTTLDNHKFTRTPLQTDTCQIMLYRSELAHSHLDRHTLYAQPNTCRITGQGFSKTQVGKSVKQLFNLELPHAQKCIHVASSHKNPIMLRRIHTHTHYAHTHTHTHTAAAGPTHTVQMSSDINTIQVHHVKWEGVYTHPRL